MILQVIKFLSRQIMFSALSPRHDQGPCVCSRACVCICVRLCLHLCSPASVGVHVFICACVLMFANRIYIHFMRPWSNESNISPSSVHHSCSVNCWIRLATCCTVLGAARCCSTLFDGNQKRWESNRAFQLFEVFIWRQSFELYVCTDSTGHSAGGHETLEMLDGCWIRLTRA